MVKTFLISDTHFHHNSPYTKFFLEDGVTLLRPHGSADAGDEAMIENWNRVVKPDSKVYHLGDVTMGATAKSFEIMRRLNGTKILIKGNHDIAKLSIYAEHFKDVRGTHKLGNLVLSHIPLHPAHMSDRWLGNVHGHLHHRAVLGAYGKDDPRYFSVCVERINYTPIELDAVIAHFEKLA